ncbi:neutral zinc metallopeptidase [Nonomuraea sp. NPDC050451]|uniref:neutral zinc metallopeptidase n=1 Tax=Nonomuraea sp. NPDC050451 TaxID=3364364 RepID=UPI0037B0A644
MKLLMFAALTGALMMPLAGTATAQAAAYPVKSSQLTANPLYEAGALPTTTCTEESLEPNNLKQARDYLDGIVACLETTWEQHLTKAGVTYRPVKVRHMNRIPKKYCGFDVGKENSQAWYCDRTETLVFQLGKDWLDEPDDLWLFDTAASMYGYHVQKLAGITKAYDKLSYDKKAEMYEQDRRVSLQTECFGAAFLKSVWPLEGRNMSDWNTLVRLLQGDDPDEFRDYGRPASVRYWLKRGFTTGDPGSCNTWAAPSSKVA